MRLDKYLSDATAFSRRELKSLIRGGQVAVCGKVIKSPEYQVESDSQITLKGETVFYRKFVYLMMNKPAGFISATEDGRGDPVVTDLFLPEHRKMGIFPCGRLDKHTLGLMLLTNDGALSHKLLAPKSHVTKTYGFRVKFPLSAEDVETLERGVDIGGYLTKPCQMLLMGEREGKIVLTEGKYHQIKLMMQAVHNQITYLERITFGPLTLDSALSRGEWRELTDEEIALLQQ